MARKNTAEVVIIGRDEASGQFEKIIGSSDALFKSAEENAEALAKKVESENEKLTASIEKMGIAVIRDQKDRLQAQANLKINAVKKSIGSEKLKANSIRLIETKLQQDLGDLRTEASKEEVRLRQEALDAQASASKESMIALQAGLEIVGDAFRVVGAAVSFAIDELGQMTEAAIQQEESDRSLALAIGAAGESAEEWLPVLKASASSLQTLTGVGDETTQQLSTLLLNFGVAIEKIPSATEATLDFAEAAGINAEEASRRLGRSLSGSIDDVAKFAPEVRNLTKEQLANGEAIDLIGEKFKGFSSELRSSGSLIRGAEGAFGDLREEFGQSIIESEAFRSAIVAVTEFLVELQGQADGMNLGQTIVVWAAAGIDFVEVVLSMVESMESFSAEVDRGIASFFRLLPGAELTAKAFDDAARGSEFFAKRSGILRESLARLSEKLDEASVNSDTFSVAAGRTADADRKAAAEAARHAAARAVLATSTAKANETLFGELRKFRVAAIEDEEERVREEALLRAEEIGQLKGDAELRVQVLAAVFEERDRQLAEIAATRLEEEQKDQDEFDKIQDEALKKLSAQLDEELSLRRQKEDAIRGFQNELAIIGLEGAELILAQEEQRLAELETLLQREPELREVIEAEKLLIMEQSREAMRDLEEQQVADLDAVLSELGGLATQTGADVIRSIIDGAKGERDQAAVFEDIVKSLITTGLSAALLAIPGGAALAPLVGAITGSFHTGGMIPTAHTGLFAGQDTLIRAQQGEMILSRERVGQIGGPGIAQGIGAGTIPMGGGGTTIFQLATPSPASFDRELRHGEMKRSIERAEKRGDLRRR